MGGFISTAQRGRSFCEGARNSGPADRLCLDEERSDLGRSDAFDRRNVCELPAKARSRKRSLLAELIGGDPDFAENMANRLLCAFGSIDGVLSARPECLGRITNDRELANRIAAARSVVMEGLGEQILRTRFDLNDLALQRWVVGLFKGLKIERIHLVFLDRSGRLIFDEPLSEGNLLGVTGNFRALVRRGIDVDASAVVLMHNHPSGNPHPSDEDVKETRRIAELLENLDLRLHDHVIVSGCRIFSMRGAGLI